MLRYLDDQGLTLEAINRFKLGVRKANKNLWLLYPSMVDGIPRYVKYRLLPFEKELTDAEKESGLTKFKREKGAPSILFNQDAISKHDTIIVTEGERDAITLLMLGYTNVVGTTGGAQTLKTEWYDALYEMLEADKVEKLLERNVIEVAPIAFMRGRTLNDSFIILDEAQNSTPEQMKMVLTRQGFNSKMVVTGDITQIDLPASRGSGLLHAMEVLRGIDDIRFVTFDEKDVVRHSLVQKIIKAYERYQETAPGRQLSLRWNEAAADKTADNATGGGGPEAAHQ